MAVILAVASTSCGSGDSGVGVGIPVSTVDLPSTTVIHSAGGGFDCDQVESEAAALEAGAGYESVDQALVEAGLEDVLRDGESVDVTAGARWEVRSDSGELITAARLERLAEGWVVAEVQRCFEP
jgi:hypothetical protein